MGEGKPTQEPERWRQAVAFVAASLNDAGLPYKIVGGASVALHGVPIAVHDVDIETDEGTAYRIARLFADHVIQPVTFVEGEAYRSHFGRLRVADVTFEVMGDLHRREGRAWVPTYTLTLEVLSVHGVPVRVSWLEEEVLAYIRRGRLERAALCLPYCDRDRLLALLRGQVRQGVL